jgi:hypothetical protein
MQANLARLGDNNESPNGMQPDFMRLLTGTPFVPSHAHRSLILHSLNNSTQEQRGKQYRFSNDPPAGLDTDGLDDDMLYTLSRLCTKHARLDTNYKFFLAWDNKIQPTL